MFFLNSVQIYHFPQDLPIEFRVNANGMNLGCQKLKLSFQTAVIKNPRKLNFQIFSAAQNDNSTV